MNGMNKCRLNALAEWLEAGAPAVKGVDGFRMDSWKQKQNCGTVCCLAGTAVEWWGDPKQAQREQNYEYMRQGTELLRLDPTTARQLFWPWRDGASQQHAALRTTPFGAAKVIRHLIETGEVNWSKAQ